MFNQIQYEKPCRTGRGGFLCILLVCASFYSIAAAEDLNGYTFNIPAALEEDDPNSVEPSRKETSEPVFPDLSGRWEIIEADKSYVATLDPKGNGGYTWQNGKMITTHFSDRRWKGTWHQTGNDREGGFEVLLSEDGNQARGIWWYTRVGTQDNIPPREWGGEYTWNRFPLGQPGEISEEKIPRTQPSTFQKNKIQNEEGP